MRKTFFLIVLVLVVATAIVAQPSVRPIAGDTTGVLYFRKLIAGREAMVAFLALQSEAAKTTSLPKTVGLFRRAEAKKLAVEANLLSDALVHGIECTGFYQARFQMAWKKAYWLRKSFSLEPKKLENKDKFVAQFDSATRTRAWEIFESLPIAHNLAMSLRISQVAATGIEKKLRDQYLLLQETVVKNILTTAISSGVISYMTPVQLKGFQAALRQHFPVTGKKIFEYSLGKTKKLKEAKAWGGGFFYTDMTKSMEKSVVIVVSILDLYGYKVHPLQPPRKKKILVKT